jgi:hypothetical protein
MLLFARCIPPQVIQHGPIPDPHLYFQVPGGQCLQLVGIDEDLSFYEGAGAGPDVAKVKEAIKKESTKR